MMGVLKLLQGRKAMVCLTPEELRLEWDTFALSYGSKVSSIHHQRQETGISTWGFLHPKTSP